MTQTTAPLIAPFKTGLEQDIQPWMAPPDSFYDLNNFHVEHEFIEKRNGYRYLPKNSASLTNGTPVTGFANFVSASTGIQTLLAFDTLSAYSYSSSSQIFTQLSNFSGGATSLFTGGGEDYFWSANWNSTSSSASANRTYFSNGISLTGTGATAQDGIWYYDGTGNTVTSFVPFLGSGPTIPVLGCKLIFTLGQRLILFYTDENGTTYPQRARWCAKQNPGETTGWIDSVAGGGDYADAATSDIIISAQVLQNQIIVFFTNSVWSLVPTSDPNKAFRWQKINNFRAVEGKMGSVMYDRNVKAVGIRGITATDGPNTVRIDQRISDFVINNMSQENISQTFCERDYATRRWWTLYNDGSSDTQKTKALIYDDDSGAFSTYTINLNVLGRAPQGYDYQYDEFTAANGFEDPEGNDIRYADFNNDETYNSYNFQQNNQSFIGGGYEGEVFVLESGNSDDTASIDTSFLTAAWNPFYQEGKECVMPFVDIYLETSPSDFGTVSFYKNTEAIPYKDTEFDFLPDLNYLGSISDVDKTDPAEITAFNHGLTTGDEIYIYLVKGMEEINSTNQAAAYTVSKISDDVFSLDGIDSSAFSDYEGGGNFYEREFYRTKTWKRLYAGGTGFQHRLGFTSSGVNQTFRIHGFKPAFKPRGQRLSN